MSGVCNLLLIEFLWMDNNEATITVTDTPLFITTKRNDGGTDISGRSEIQNNTILSYLLLALR